MALTEYVSVPLSERRTMIRTRGRTFYVRLITPAVEREGYIPIGEYLIEEGTGVYEIDDGEKTIRITRCMSPDGALAAALMERRI